MNDQAQKLARSYNLSAKVSAVLQKRLQRAQERFAKRVQEAYNNNIDKNQSLKGTPLTPWNFWQEGYDYAVDLAQRTILFWDTLRQRGTNFITNERTGARPALHFDYETVLDAREFARPVNYALVRIVPPEGITVDAKRRPYVI